MAELTPDALAKFEQTVTDEFIERLAIFASRRKRSRYWRGVWDGHLPEGKEVADIVQEAIDDVLLGRRTWNPEKHPDLLDFMRSVVNSKISHLQTGSENLSDELPSVATHEDGTDHFDTLPSKNSATAAELLQAKEDEERNNDLIFRFYDFVAADPLVQGIVGCTIEGMTKRADIAAALKVKEQEITNANKRLDRCFKDFRKVHADKNPFKSPTN
jgi:hypothetical protein